MVQHFREKVKVTGDVSTNFTPLLKSLSVVAEVDAHNYEYFLFEFRQNDDDVVFSVDGQTDLGRPDGVVLTNTFILRGTSVSQLMDVKTVLTGKQSASETRAEFTAKSMDGDYDLAVTGVADSTGSMRATLKGSAPILNLNGENAVVDVKIEGNSGKITVDSRGRRKFDLSWTAGPFGVEGALKSDIYLLQEVTYSFTFEDDETGKRTYVAYVNREGIEYTATVGFAPLARGKLLAEATVTLPANLDPRRSRADDTWTFKTKYQYRVLPSSRTAEGLIEIGDQKVHAFWSSAIGGLAGETKVTLNLPLFNFRATTDNAYDLRGFHARTRTTYGDKTLLKLALALDRLHAQVDLDCTGLGGERLFKAAVAGKVEPAEEKADLLVQWGNVVLFRVDADYNLRDFMNEGRIGLVGFTAWTRVPRFEANFDYDTSRYDRTAKLAFNSQNFTLKLNTVFQMSSDTLDSETLVESSWNAINGWKVSAGYNIRAIPEAKVTLERGDVKKVVAVKINLDHVIPTIDIRTPFAGYETLRFTGRYESLGRERTVKLFCERNGERLVSLATVFALTDERLEVSAAATTPFDGWRDLKLVVQASFSSFDQFYSGTLKFAKESRVLFLLDGRLSLSEKKEVRMEVKTPFPGFESIVLAGMSGSTSVGRSLGMAYEYGGREKRELAVEYSLGDDEAAFELRTPLSDFRKVGVRTRGGRVRRDTADVEFDFENGENYFSMGAKYDVSQGPRFGSVTLKFMQDKTIDIPDSDIQISLVPKTTIVDLEYKNLLDFNSGAVLEGEVYFGGNKVLSGRSVVTMEEPFSWTGDFDATLPNGKQFEVDVKLNKCDPQIVVKRNGEQLVSIVGKNNFEVKENQVLPSYLPDIPGRQMIPVGDFTLTWTGFGEDGKIELVFDVDGDEKDIHVLTQSQAGDVYLYLRTKMKVVDRTKSEVNYNAQFGRYYFESHTKQDMEDQNNYSRETTYKTNIGWFGWREKIVIEKQAADKERMVFRYDYKSTTDGVDYEQTYKFKQLAPGKFKASFEGNVPWRDDKLKVAIEAKSEEGKFYAKVTTNVPNYETNVMKVA